MSSLSVGLGEVSVQFYWDSLEGSVYVGGGFSTTDSSFFIGLLTAVHDSCEELQRQTLGTGASLLLLLWWRNCCSHFWSWVWQLDKSVIHTWTQLCRLCHFWKHQQTRHNSWTLSSLTNSFYDVVNRTRGMAFIWSLLVNMINTVNMTPSEGTQNAPKRWKFFQIIYREGRRERKKQVRK